MTIKLNLNLNLMAEGLESMAAFIGQGSPMRPFDRHVKQPVTVCFIQHHITSHDNIVTTLFKKKASVSDKKEFPLASLIKTQ